MPCKESKEHKTNRRLSWTHVTEKRQWNEYKDQYIDTKIKIDVSMLFTIMSHNTDQQDF